MNIIAALLLLAAVTATSATYVCDFHKAVRGFFKTGIDVGKVMCIAQHSSNFRTGYHSNDFSHGILQISAKTWCKGDRYPSPNLCNLDCKKLEDDKFDDDVACAFKIYKAEGFLAWSVFQRECVNKSYDYFFLKCRA